MIARFVRVLTAKMSRKSLDKRPGSRQTSVKANQNPKGKNSTGLANQPKPMKKAGKTKPIKGM
jgi:hypothetical protein